MDKHLKWINNNWLKPRIYKDDTEKEKKKKKEWKPPYNWYHKYGSSDEQNLKNIIDKYGQEEIRQILVMIKVLHGVNEKILNMTDPEDLAAGMASGAIVHDLTLYKLLEKYHEHPKDSDDIASKRKYLNVIGSKFLDKEKKNLEYPLLLLDLKKKYPKKWFKNREDDELYQIMGPDESEGMSYKGNEWFRGVIDLDLNKKIWIRNADNTSRKTINPFNKDDLERYVLIPKVFHYNYDNLYIEDFETERKNKWIYYHWAALRQAAQRHILPAKDYSGLTRMEPRGVLPYQNQLELYLDKWKHPTVEATLSLIFHGETKKTYYPCCTLCGHIIPDGNDVDHIFNLHLNSLLNLESHPAGYSNTCAACNQFFKRDRVFSLRKDSWDEFKKAAYFEKDIGVLNHYDKNLFDIEDAEGYDYYEEMKDKGNRPNRNIMKKTAHIDSLNEKYRIVEIHENIREDFYIRRILYVVKNTDIASNIMRIVRGDGKLRDLKKVGIEDIKRGIDYLYSIYSDKIKLIKQTALLLESGNKRLKAIQKGKLSPDTKKKIGHMSTSSRKAIQQDIQKNHMRAFEKAAHIQMKKDQEVLYSSPGRLSGSQFDEQTTDILEAEHNKLPHIDSQDVHSLFNKKLKNKEKMDEIRKKGIRTREGALFANKITGERLRKKIVWCEENMDDLRQQYEESKRIKEQMEHEKKTHLKAYKNVKNRYKHIKNMYNECVRLVEERDEESGMTLAEQIIKYKREKARKKTGEPTYTLLTSSSDDSSDEEIAAEAAASSSKPRDSINKKSPRRLPPLRKKQRTKKKNPLEGLWGGKRKKTKKRRKKKKTKRKKTRRKRRRKKKKRTRRKK
jgi:hypothetical protein